MSVRQVSVRYRSKTVSTLRMPHFKPRASQSGKNAQSNAKKAISIIVNCLLKCSFVPSAKCALIGRQNGGGVLRVKYFTLGVYPFQDYE